MRTDEMRTPVHKTSMLFICHREGHQEVIRMDAHCFSDAVRFAACGLECLRSEVICRYVKTMTAPQSEFDKWNAMPTDLA